MVIRTGCSCIGISVVSNINQPASGVVVPGGYGELADVSRRHCTARVTSLYALDLASCETVYNGILDVLINQSDKAAVDIIWTTLHTVTSNPKPPQIGGQDQRSERPPPCSITAATRWSRMIPRCRPTVSLWIARFRRPLVMQVAVLSPISRM
jgi:hypothetical protein